MSEVDWTEVHFAVVYGGKIHAATWWPSDGGYVTSFTTDEDRVLCGPMQFPAPDPSAVTLWRDRNVLNERVCSDCEQDLADDEWMTDVEDERRLT